MPEYVPSKQLPTGRFALSPGKFVYFVLSSGVEPVLWKIGRKGPDEALKPLRGNEAHHVLVWKQVFLPIPAPKEVDTTLTGATWKRHGKRTITAKVIGVVGRTARRQLGKERVMMAKYVSQKFSNFTFRPLRRFLKTWVRDDSLKLPDWLTVAADAKSARQI